MFGGVVRKMEMAFPVHLYMNKLILSDMHNSHTYRTYYIVAYIIEFRKEPSIWTSLVTRDCWKDIHYPIASMGAVTSNFH